MNPHDQIHDACLRELQNLEQLAAKLQRTIESLSTDYSNFTEALTPARQAARTAGVPSTVPGVDSIRGLSLRSDVMLMRELARVGLGHIVREQHGFQGERNISDTVKARAAHIRAELEEVANG